MVGHEDPFISVRRKMVVARIEFMGRLAAFNNDQLLRSFSENDRSPLHIAYHLYVIDGLVLEQMRAVQRDDGPQLVNPVELPLDYLVTDRQQDSSTFTLEVILAGMAARREEIFRYLASLPLTAWERVFSFEDATRLHFYQLVNFLPLHDQQHARQLATLKARFDHA